MNSDHALDFDFDLYFPTVESSTSELYCPSPRSISSFNSPSRLAYKRDMSATVGDYLFWRLASIGVQRVLGRNRSSLFIGSIQRNYLTYVDITRSNITPASNEVGAFVASATAGDLAACYEEGRRLFAWRPVVFIGELNSAQFTSAAEVTAGLNFAAATIISNPTTATSQINRVLEVALYENKPVYIGVSLAVAGQVTSTTQAQTTSSAYGSPTGYPTSGQYGYSADASVAMSFIR